MSLKIDIVRCLSDNYAYIIYDTYSKNVGVVDPSEFDKINTFLEKKYNKLDFIINTHHHADHIGGNSELKKKFNSKIVAYSGDTYRINDVDIKVNDNEIFHFGKTKFKVLKIPGHTSGHISFYSSEEKVIFTGDTLFSFGCGRIFEGSYLEMFNSLKKIKSLPKDTKIYFGHEYTVNNINFCLSFDQKNIFLKKKLEEIKSNLKNNIFSTPSILEDELKGNLFLKANNPAEFKKYRELKDSF